MQVAEVQGRVLSHFNRHHRKAFEAVAAQWLVMGFDENDFIKYFKAEINIISKSAWYCAIFERPDMTHLDIGCGMGWLSYVAGVMGHDSMLADIPDEMVIQAKGYREGLEALGLKKDYAFYVKRKIPVPVVEKFDVISATGTAFHKDWAASDWEFFLSDLLVHLNPGGLIFLQVNHTGKVGSGFHSLRHEVGFSGLQYHEWLDVNTLKIRV